MSTFDVAVIGAGLPGLAAAVLLARANRRVVVLDPEEEPGGALVCRDRGTVRFSPGPQITQGFGPGGGLRYLYAAAGLAVPPHSSLLTYQVALPDRRITVFSEPDATLEELRREFPREIDRISRLLNDLRGIASKCAHNRLSHALTRRRSAGGFLQSRRCSRELTAYFSAQARFFFGQPVSGTTLVELADMVSVPPVLVPGGWHVLAGRLRDVLTSLGGEYRSREPWPALQVRSRHIAPFGTSTGSVSARSVVLNTLWEEQRSLFFGLRKHGLPVGMASTVICLPEYDEPHEVFVLSCCAEENAPAGARDLDAMTVNFLPAGGQALPDGRLFDRVRTIMPFIDAFVVLADKQELRGGRTDVYDPFLRSVSDRSGGASYAAARAVKQLHLLQDRTYALPRPIEAARRLAARLA